MKKENIVKEEKIQRMLERKRSLDCVTVRGLSNQTCCKPSTLNDILPRCIKLAETKIVGVIL